jgi:uncharacterized LabA/DUF88 family protein
MTTLLPRQYRGKPHRVMMFIDGENLSIRSGDLVDTFDSEHVKYEKDVFIWSTVINKGLEFYNVLRKNYYTSAVGDESHIASIEDQLRTLEIESPRVYKKAKGRSSKRVDISLSVDMLWHACNDNYDIAILATGDEDFVPLVDAVCSNGKVVVLWALSSGLSVYLKRAADYYFDLTPVLTRTKSEAWYEVFQKKA